MDQKHILIHMCCAPCATSSIERVLNEGYIATLYFSNSNIWPHEEYLKRLKSAHLLGDLVNIHIEEDEYDHEKWLNIINGLENEPEKGLRCSKCFEFSLHRAAIKADQLEIPYFTTTLTVSPHKISKNLFAIGAQYSKYIPFDFKKKDGFKRSIELSKKYDLYRQQYCGCEFSLRKK